MVIRARDMTRGVFRRIGRSMRGLAGRIAALAGLGALAKLATDGIRAAQSMKTLAEGVGLSTTEFQALARQMERFGVDADDVSDALFSISQARAEAINGNDQMADSYRALGIDMRTLMDRNNPLDFFLMLSHAAEQAGDNVFDMQHHFSRIMGEDNARRMMAALRQGPSAMAAGMMAAVESGRTLSIEQVEGASSLYIKSLEATTMAQNATAKGAIAAAEGLVQLAAAVEAARTVGVVDTQNPNAPATGFSAFSP